MSADVVEYVFTIIAAWVVVSVFAGFAVARMLGANRTEDDDGA